MKYNNKLKIKDGFIVDEIITKFEENSPIVKSMKDFSLTMKIISIIGIIYFLIVCCIQKYVFISLIFVLSVVLLIVMYLCKKSADVLYLNSKHRGGKKSSKIQNLKKNLDITTYNLKIMQKEELKILKKILKINNINNIESIRELKNYYNNKKRKKPIEIKNFIATIISIYIIPITFGVINIYTSISTNIELEDNLVNIAYIIFTAVVILSIILIIYMIFEIRNYSTARYYTIPKLEKLLSELIIKGNF